jgi:chromosome segregation ATPase
MIKLKDLEAEMGRVVADNKSRQSENALKISRLSREIEEKELKILDIERRMKSSLDDRDDKQIQLMNSCEKVKSRLEERIAHLQAQLDKATDALRQVKVSMVDKQLLDEAVSKAANLKRSLERQHELSQQQEEELHTSKEEKRQLQISVTKSEKMVKSLSGKLQSAKRDFATREKQIESMNRLEMQKLRDQTRCELTSMECDLKAESEFRQTRVFFTSFYC